MSAIRLSRRQFIEKSAFACLAFRGSAREAFASFAQTPQVRVGYKPPDSPRAILNFNYSWKFTREDVQAAELPGFDDSGWSTVATPHSFNDIDSFRETISHGGGDRGTYKGIAWYRKHFRLPAEFSGRRVFLEFEGMRQAGDIYLNGKGIGLYENGVNPYGVEITSALRSAGQDNVLAVRVDNTTTYKERAFCQANPKSPDGSSCVETPFEWNANDFNPDHGGINRRVWLHIVGSIHQTLPLYYGLESQGVYVHAGNFNIAKKTADVTVDAEVHNTSGDRATVGLSVVVVDREGAVRAQFEGDPVDMVDGEKSVQTATGTLRNARFWSDEDPYLYDVYTILKVDEKVVDVHRLETGFRKAEFRGGVGTGRRISE